MEPVVSTRLTRVCEMMRSTNEQERATAARIATEIIGGAGLTWTQLIQAAARGLTAAPQWQWQQPPRPEPPRKPQQRAYTQQRNKKTKERWGKSAAQWVDYLANRFECLTVWEQEFIRSLKPVGRTLTLTDRQWDCIEMCLERTGLSVEV